MTMRDGVIALFLALTLTGPVSGQPADPAPFSFAAWGDVPYSRVERDKALDMLAEQAALPLAFSIHIGDIKSGGSLCDDATFADRQALLDGSTHPLILLAGDNEWTDCARESAGGFAPHERLDALRARFFATGESLGQRRLALTRQDCCAENVRWSHQGVLFATLNVSGSALPPGPRSAQLEAATLRWLDETFVHAQTGGAQALVIAFHANPAFADHAKGTPRPRYRSLLDRLALGAARYARPVLLIHGDTHRYRVDQPLHDPRSGAVLDNVTRLETHGSPWLGWTLVKVDPAAMPPFSFEPRPQWLP